MNSPSLLCLYIHSTTTMQQGAVKFIQRKAGHTDERYILFLKH